MKHYVLYIPGLGDKCTTGQAMAVRLWRIYGVRSELIALRWDIAEPLNTKLNKLYQRIDTLHEQGYTVSLVGVSAGAGVVIHAFSNRQNSVHKVVCLCGKLQNAGTIGSATYQWNPAFSESMQRLPETLHQLDALTLQRILSIKPLSDESVPPRDTIIPGTHSTTIPTHGHALSIGMGLTVFSYKIIRFIRRGR